MHTKQNTANCHYPTLLQAAKSAKDMGDTITKWLSRSDDVLKDYRADKTRRTVRLEGVWMVNPIELDYEHLLPSPLLPKMDDPGTPTIHRSINQRSFQRSCPQHGNKHFSMSKMADQDH
jgi:hypothetical protein